MDCNGSGHISGYKGLHVYLVRSDVLFSACAIFTCLLSLNSLIYMYSKTCVNRPLLKDRKLVFKTNYSLMQVQGSILQILSTFIKLPFVIKIFVLFIFEWLFYTGFTVAHPHAELKV